MGDRSKRGNGRQRVHDHDLVPETALVLRDSTHKQMKRLAMYNDCKIIATDGEVHATRVMIGSVSEVLRYEFGLCACYS